MINNVHLAVIVVGLVACEVPRLEPERRLQGVVELEETLLAFEVGGRLATVDVRRGDALKAKAPVASLDDHLARTELAARQAEADAAKAQLQLLQDGARPEEIGALAARVRAARASEELLSANLQRERALASKGVSTRAVVDDLDKQLAAAKANRQALQQELARAQKGARKPELDGASARADALTHTVELGDERIARHLLTAPKAGVVLDLHVELGEVVAPGTPIISLGDTERPYVDVFVAIAELGDIAVGKAASVQVDGSDKTYSAHVDWIARTTEFTPRYVFSDRERPNLVVRVRLVVDDPDDALHVGVPAFASVEGRREEAP
jgi:HlyD family secretion protein